MAAVFGIELNINIEFLTKMPQWQKLAILGGTIFLIIIFYLWWWYLPISG